METLALQLAELLEISVDKAIELYPVLRTQFIVFKITGSLTGLLIPFTAVVLGMFASGWVICTIETEESERYSEGSTGQHIHMEKAKQMKRLKNIGIVGSIVALLSLTLLNVIKVIFATDLMMMLEFL